MLQFGSCTIIVFLGLIGQLVSADGCPYTIKKGDTVDSLAERCQTAPTSLGQMNPQVTDINSITASKMYNLPCTCSLITGSSSNSGSQSNNTCSRPISKGDTFAAISASCGLDPSGKDLQKMNPGVFATALPIGSNISVPCKCMKTYNNGGGQQPMCRRVSGYSQSATGQGASSATPSTSSASPSISSTPSSYSSTPPTSSSGSSTPPSYSSTPPNYSPSGFGKVDIAGSGSGSIGGISGSGSGSAQLTA